MKPRLYALDQATSDSLNIRWWLRMIFILLLLTPLSFVAPGQTKQWDKTIGGSSDDQLSSLRQTSDGGYILGGSSYSDKSGDKSEDNRGEVTDYWVVKLDATGNKEWDKTIGGSGEDVLFSLQQTRDGGYLLGGFSFSGISGDKTEANEGSYDYWVVKLDAAGEKEWDRTFGGSDFDQLYSLQQTSDGGYILGGYSNSPVSGDKTEANKGPCDEGCTFDYWVVKLGAAGEKEWDRTFGGSETDQLPSLEQTSEGGYVLGGTSDSPVSGDKTEASRGSEDYWVVKLDAAGEKEWDRTFGGNSTDVLTSLEQTSEGGYVLGGYSFSDISGDKTEANKGGADYWVVKLGAAGEKEWDRTFGGSDFDQLYSLQQTNDGGYIMGGLTASGISGDKTEASRGSEDYWVVKLDAAGEKAWDRAFGGSGAEALSSLRQTSEGGYILGGNSYSGISGDKTEASWGQSDYWVVKLNNDANPCDQAVTGFSLLNAGTGEELLALQQGDTLDLTALPTQNLSIRANTTPATVGRVLFHLDSTSVVEDNTGPYTITSKTMFVNGPHTLTATPYCEAGASGGKGAALTVSFLVVSNVRIVTIPADKDNTLSSNSPENNLGSDALRTGRTGDSGGFTLYRALLHFDLSSIPAGSTIDSTVLTLYVLRTGPSATGVALHRATADWGEMESTWSHAFFPGTPWATPGGDFEPAATVSTGPVDSDEGSLDIPNLAADVQAWVNDPAANFGWVLRVTEEETAFSAKLLVPRESSDESLRPVLRVIYTVEDDPAPCEPTVESFTLVNADTDEDIMPLREGDVLDLSALPTRNLDIRANTAPATVGSVVFGLDGAVAAVENLRPYTFSGKVKLTVGTHTLTATPYCGARGEGEAGTALTVTFQVVEDSQCPDLAEAVIQGNATAAVNTTGSAYTLSASRATSFSWNITDPDGNAYTNFTGQGTGTIAVDWPAEPNVYKVSVTYGGGAGCPSQTAVIYVHVFDPKAGFVSGGGWSDSPAAPDHELMREGGRVYWGFVAKYKRGDTDRVEGSALVLLESGPAAFRSTSVEDGSLVIAGERAYFRGTGTLAWHENSGIVTDARRFGFLVAATDGQLGSRTAPDKLRLKIWVIEEGGSEGEVVYDSQAACPSASPDDNVEACQAIDKGSIVIHRGGRGLSAWLSLAAEEAAQDGGLQAYPTAFSDRTTLAFAAGSDTGYTLELYDLKGALVRRIAAGTAEVGRRYEHEVRAAGMANGVYLARLTTQEEVQTVKLILKR